MSKKKTGNDYHPDLSDPVKWLRKLGKDFQQPNVSKSTGNGNASSQTKHQRYGENIIYISVQRFEDAYQEGMITGTAFVGGLVAAEVRLSISCDSMHEYEYIPPNSST